MKKFIVTYENKETRHIMHEKVLVHADDYLQAREKTIEWLNKQGFRSGEVVGVVLYHFREEIL